MAIYKCSEQEGRLWQGELLSGVVQVKLTLDSVRPGTQSRIDRVTHPLALVLTQDCDLKSDFRAREQSEPAKQIPNILFCEVIEAGSLRTGEDIKSRQWNDVRNNKNERYQYLRDIAQDEDAANTGLRALAVDFRRFFTIPSDEV